MEIMNSKIKQILDTLPIGYYCGKNIDVELNEEEPTSFYSPTEDKIVVSTEIIKQGLNNVELTADYTMETAVRSMLYHEVSHALLTPKNLKVDQMMNIFEDERIETILKGYYMDTNFKAQLNAICGGQEIDNTDLNQVFFNAVRFRIGKKEWTDEVERIIEKYKGIDITSPSYQSYENPTIQGYQDYYWEVQDLYCKIGKDIKTNNNLPTNEELKESLEQTIQQLIEEENKCAEDREKKSAKGGTPSQNEGNSENCENGENSEGQQSKGKMTETDGELKETEEYGRNGGHISLRDVMSKITDKYVDDNIVKQLEIIIQNFNKKNNSGNGSVGYSGRMNPRNFLRDDYKYFDRKVSINGNNKFGTCHLNLFIDESGSFYRNVDEVNKLITALGIVERNNHNFTFDVIGMECGMEVKPKNNRLIKANGGNELYYDETSEIFRSHQLRNTCNYNIVLFDGYTDSCDTQGSWGRKQTKPHCFNIFNTPNTTMILEEDNRQAIVKNKIKTARVIWENTNYSEKLLENVINILRSAFK